MRESTFVLWCSSLCVVAFAMGCGGDPGLEDADTMSTAQQAVRTTILPDCKQWQNLETGGVSGSLENCLKAGSAFGGVAPCVCIYSLGSQEGGDLREDWKCTARLAEDITGAFLDYQKEGYGHTRQEAAARALASCQSKFSNPPRRACTLGTCIQIH